MEESKQIIIRRVDNKQNVICEHQTQKYRCIQCGGGSICIHKKRKDCCKLCGNSYCQHGKQYNRCKICDENKWLAQKMRYSINKAIKRDQKKQLQYVECSMQQLREHIELQFTEIMNWDNYGEVWTIDHILPLNPNYKLTKEELIQRFHYTNIQPLLKKENMSKGNRTQILRQDNNQ